MTKILKENIKNYWWFRLLKVIYILGFITSVLLFVALAIDEIPVIDKYSSTYQFKCNIDGVLRGNIEGSYFYNYDEFSFKDDLVRDLPRFICLDPNIINIDRTQFNLQFEQARRNGMIPNSDNFIILLKNPIYYGSWSYVISYLLLGSLGTFIIFWTIKVIFLYIVIGSIPQIPFKEKILRWKNNKLSNPQN